VFGSEKDMELKDLRYEVKSLKMDLNMKQYMIDSLQKELKELKETSECQCVNLFDFNNPSLNVFAIERVFDGYKWKTNIGYLIKNDPAYGIHEWSIQTTIDQHAFLVKTYEQRNIQE